VKRSSLLLAAVLGVVGFLLVTAAFSAREAERQAAPGKSQLIRLIGQRRADVSDLEKAVNRLRGDVRDARQRDAQRSRAGADEANAEALLAAQAGTTELAGPGLTVRLSDSGRQPTPTEDASALRIHDTDLQLVVNALFASGAEAVAINDNRIVATGPIRAAGSTIVVDFRPLVPPYSVVAVGADRNRFEHSDIAQRFRRWTTLYGLGFSASSDQVVVPAYAGRVAITNAQPGE
jgi:uncharacterized protein YlxW (UPF0749 family)